MSRKPRPATRKSRSSGIRASKPESAQKCLSFRGRPPRPEPGIQAYPQVCPGSTFRSHGASLPGLSWTSPAMTTSRRALVIEIGTRLGDDLCGCVDLIATRRGPSGNYEFPMGYTSIAMSAMSAEPPSSIDQSPKSSPKTRPSVVEIANCAIIVPFGIYPVLPLVRLGRKKVRCANGVSVRPCGARRR
jgi:hypothetical protein